MPGSGRQQAAQHADGGGFARAVGSQEAEDFALGHLQRDVVHGHERAEGLHQVVDFHRPAVAVHACAACASTVWMVLMNAPSRLADAGLPLHVFRRRAADQLALVHQAHAVAALGLVQVGGGHEDGDAVLQKLIQNGPEIAARNRVHAVGRLVQKQNPRAVQQGAHQRQLLFHAAGEACRPGASRNGSMRVIRSRSHGQIAGAPRPQCRTGRRRSPCSPAR